MIRIGIVGAGGIASVHARHFIAMGAAELSVYDHDSERQTAFSERFDAVPRSSMKDLIDEADVVDVCLPTHVHFESAMKSIQAGRATLVEKPIARTIEEATSLLEAASKRSTPFMVGHVVRFFHEFETARRLVMDGAVGKPAAARTRRGGKLPTGSSDWFADHLLSGGVLLDLAVHDFDWLLWTLGPVSTVMSVRNGPKPGHGAECALSTLTFKSGAVAHVESTWMDPGGFRTTLEVSGSEGLVRHDSRETAFLRTVTNDGSKVDSGIAAADDPFARELRTFLDAVTTGKPVPIDPSESVAALAVSLAAIESAATFKPVRLAG